MKLLVFRDTEGNDADYALAVPERMHRWRMTAFRDFMRRGHHGAREAGYLPEPLDDLHYDSLRQLLAGPAATLNTSLAFEQAGRRLRLQDEIDLSAEINLVAVRRSPDGPEPDSGVVSVATRNRLAFKACRKDVAAAVDALFGFDEHRILNRDGRQVSSFDEVVEDFHGRLDVENQVRFLYRIARVVHAAPFENVSKLIDGVRFRSGCAMWGNLARGFGGICAEKTAAVKFICDVLSVPSTPVLGSRAAIPSDFEAQLKAYVDAGGQAEPPVWVEHHLLEIEIDRRRYLVDATNGNIPFMFLDEADSRPLLDRGARARMVYHVEHLKLARASNWVGDTLLTLSEFHVPDLLYQFIFEQGLHISERAYLGVYFDWGGERSAAMQGYYAAQARRTGMLSPRFIGADDLDYVPDEDLRALLREALAALRARFGGGRYTGDFTFVLQPLPPHFWRLPRLSASVRQLAGPRE